MVPLTSLTGSRQTGVPRARGDGPDHNPRIKISSVCSPRTRGWSPSRLGVEDVEYVLPAHAGMVPARRTGGSAGPCAPRARGDGPIEPRWGDQRLVCSPRAQGWSRLAVVPRIDQSVLPAHAGMAQYRRYRSITQISGNGEPRGQPPPRHTAARSVIPLRAEVPVRTPARNSLQAAGEKASAGLAGSLLSRTATRPGRFAAASTQLSLVAPHQAIEPEYIPQPVESHVAREFHQLAILPGSRPP